VAGRDVLIAVAAVVFAIVVVLANAVVFAVGAWPCGARRVQEPAHPRVDPRGHPRGHPRGARPREQAGRRHKLAAIG
jgi:hypothetical protein